MKFKKTALFVAVSAIASVSVANLPTDLTAEQPAASVVDNRPLDNSPEMSSSATTLETIAPVLPLTANIPSEATNPVAITAPVGEPAVAQSSASTPLVTETPPALAGNFKLPPPPPGSQGLVGKQLAQKPAAKDAPIMTTVAASETSKSDSASSVRADKSGVAMSSDILFGFAGHSVNAEARTMLDRIIPKLKAMDLDIVLATGHADRIGSEAANENLALKRANAVRDYFVKSGIPAAKIKVQGKGSSEPISTGCESKTGAALQECLAVDRRVNIVAQGSGSSIPMSVPANGKAATTTSARVDASTTFTVHFDGTSIKLKATDNDLLDEIADAAIEADKVHLRGRSAIGDTEQRKARAIARGWAVRQGLVFRGVEKEDIRIFYRTKGLKQTDDNERVDVELVPRKVATK